MGGKDILRFLRQAGNQLAAAQRFHNHDRQTFAVRILKTAAAGLTVLVHIVILDQAEIPVIAIEQAAIGIAVAVVGESDLPDGAGLLFLLEPLKNTQRAKARPCFFAGQHMHQVIIDMIGFEPCKLLGKELVKPLTAADKVMRQLGGDIDLIANAVPFEDFTQSGFAAGVDIGGIKVIDPGADSGHDFALRFLHVDSAEL